MSAWSKMSQEARRAHQAQVSYENSSFQDFEIRDWSPSDLGWFAGILDGEGCFGITRRRPGKKNGGGRIQLREHYSCSVTVGSIDESIVRKCREIAGVGRLTKAHKKNRKRVLYIWEASGWDARAVALLTCSRLVAKKEQADLLLGGLNEVTWNRLRTVHGRGDLYAFEGGDAA